MSPDGAVWRGRGGGSIIMTACRVDYTAAPSLAITRLPPSPVSSLLNIDNIYHKQFIFGRPQELRAWRCLSARWAWPRFGHLYYLTLCHFVHRVVMCLLQSKGSNIRNNWRESWQLSGLLTAASMHAAGAGGHVACADYLEPCRPRPPGSGRAESRSKLPIKK